ncbi:MAG: amino acid deaminase/aldolase [Actinomycetota bacterium]
MPISDAARLNAATAHLEPPFAVVDMNAFRDNARSLLSRAGGKPIRLPSKSVRCRYLQEEVLSIDGFAGTLAFTLPEALWLHSQGFEDIVVAYPTVDRTSLRDLAKLMQETPSAGVTIMVDDAAHLELVDTVVGRRSIPIRVCVDIDAGLRLARGRVRIGAKRSPLHTKEQVTGFVRQIVAHAGFRLVGLMAYEAQIAGVGDSPRGSLVSVAKGKILRAMQSRSAAELAGRRADIVAAVRSIAPLEFVNGGGTGSLETTTQEEVVTEVTAGSGLYGPALFDSYSRFIPRPAALFALPVVRRAGPDSVTLLGGGYLASGPGHASRLPVPHLPDGLRLDRQEGAGEVQTPVLGDASRHLRIGDRVWLRHAKAGELCERFDTLHLVEGDRVVAEVPTYRGEGRTFL